MSSIPMTTEEFEAYSRSVMKKKEENDARAKVWQEELKRREEERLKKAEAEYRNRRWGPDENRGLVTRDMLDVLSSENGGNRDSEDHDLQHAPGPGAGSAPDER